MAYLTEAQKTGIANLLQDWPIQKAGLIDYDMIRPLRTYEIPPAIKQDFYTPTEEEYGGEYVVEPGLKGLTEHPSISTRVIPKGPPSGLYKERGANPFPYVLDLEKFQPEWTPGATEEGELNKQIAETIGHERRHQILADNPELLEDLDITALGNNPDIVQEEYNMWLDMVAGGKGLSESDIYQNRALSRYLFMKRPGEGKFGLSGLEDLFNKMTRKYRKHMKSVEPKAGPPAGQPSIPPSQQEGGGGAPHIARSRDRGGLGISQSQAQSIREANKAAGMSGWGLAQGGLAGLLGE
jgi:hypothetical protein